MSQSNGEDPIMAEFLAQPQATQQIYLIRNYNDARAAAEAFHRSREDKYNVYYAGGTKSGVAVVGPGDDCGDATPLRRAQQPKPKPAFAGAAHSIAAGAPSAPANALRVVPRRTDYADAGAPRTRVKFSFGGGQSLVLSVNLSATVGDLRARVLENVDGSTGSLCMTALGRPLTDDSATVESAGLKMANVQCTFC